MTKTVLKISGSDTAGTVELKIYKRGHLFTPSMDF